MPFKCKIGSDQTEILLLDLQTQAEIHSTTLVERRVIRGGAGRLRQSRIVLLDPCENRMKQSLSHEKCMHMHSSGSTTEGSWKPNCGKPGSCRLHSHASRYCWREGRASSLPAPASSLPSPPRGRQHWTASCYGNLEGQLQVNGPHGCPRQDSGVGQVGLGHQGAWDPGCTSQFLIPRLSPLPSPVTFQTFPHTSHPCPSEIPFNGSTSSQRTPVPPPSKGQTG